MRELAHLRNEAARALGYRDHFAFSLTLDELDEGWLLSLLDDLEGRLLGDLGARRRRRSTTGQRARLGLPAGEPLQAVGLRRRVLPGRAARPSDDPLEAALEHLDPGRGRARLLRARSATTSTACSRAATSTRATARTSTRSAPTSTAATTCASSRTASRATRWLGDDGARARARASTTSRSTRELPWLLRQPAHTFTTEAIAMLHGRLVRDETFLERFARVDAGDRARSAQRRDAAPRAARLRALGAGHDALRARALPRSRPGSRRGLVAARRALPARRAARRARGPTTGPARSTSRWRRSTTRTTCSARSRPRSSRAALARETGAPSPAVEPAAAGEFLRERFMRPGSSMRWDALIAHATGEPLSVDHLASWLAAARSARSAGVLFMVVERFKDAGSAARLPPPARRRAAACPRGCATSTAGSSRASAAASRSWSATTPRCCRSGSCTGRASRSSRSSRS